jgi:bacillithiol system protein YtxJ
VARYIRVNTGVGQLATLMSFEPRRCRRPDTIEEAMRPDLKSLRHLSDLDSLLDGSTRRPVLLFKHSYSCGTSAEALDQLIEHLEESRHPETDYAVVTVQTHREVSNAVSARLGVRHETPQALLIRAGRVVWSASHFRVTADAVARALDTHLAPTPAKAVGPGR